MKRALLLLLAVTSCNGTVAGPQSDRRSLAVVSCVCYSGRLSNPDAREEIGLSDGTCVEYAIDALSGLTDEVVIKTLDLAMRQGCSSL